MKEKNRTNKKRLSRVEREIERYAYLFLAPTAYEEPVFCFDDGVFSYTAQKEGLKVQWEGKSEGQVFEEVEENTRFFPWETVDFALASRKKKRQAELALAILPKDEPLESPFYAVAFFVPIDERSYAAFCAYGAFERLGKDWAYMLYNPKDAFRQILRSGYIKKHRHLETGKPLEGDVPQTGV